MPEIKHQFTGGKMNKDVDERLVPNGEYRDAMNIQVSTSEGSDVGTIQNVLGNTILEGQENISNPGTCIGSISDEKNDTVYWLTTSDSFQSALDGENPEIYPINSGNYQGDLVWDAWMEEIAGDDQIMLVSNFLTRKRINSIYQAKNKAVRPVFIDEAGVTVTVQSGMSPPIANPASQLALAVDRGFDSSQALDATDGFLSQGLGFSFNSSNFQVFDGADIKVGDRVYMWGVNPWSSKAQNFLIDFHEKYGGVTVLEKTLISSWVDINGDAKEHYVLNLSESIYSLVWWEDQSKTRDFYASTGWTIPLPNITSHVSFERGLLEFDRSRLITGINIVDDMMFFTDGATEPKKINIPRSIEGTRIDGLKNTLLVNKAQNYTGYESNGLTLDLGGINKDIEKKHITVIREAPKTVLSVKSEGAPGFGRGSTSTGANFLIDPQYPVQGNSPVGAPLPFGITLFPDDDHPPVSSGDVILLNPVSNTTLPPDEHEVRLILTALTNDGSTDYVFGPVVLYLAGTYQIWDAEVVSIASYTSATPQAYNYSVQYAFLETFKNKFPRFSYRYKYQDGEYSTFGPFTSVVFTPNNNFKYEVKEAYNMAMENVTTQVKLYDYATNLPKDVKSIDILYKESNSPVVYLIDTLDEEGMSAASGGFEVTSNQIKAALPENQLLRAWDNVPRTALAQEVTGSRLIYGNYLQNYSLSNQVAISSEVTSRGLCDINGNINNSKKSLKSIRNYTLGVSFLDDYGRQSPVFTSKQSNIDISIADAQAENQLSTSILSGIPDWATHYKVFIKDVADQYYNLAMDRVYDARDGNIWLSFPSSDRNKVDDETFLILKKGVEGAQPVSEENRYKILAIENEAPEFIKTKKVLIGTATDGTSFPGTYFTNPSGYTLTDNKTIIINQPNWDVIGLSLLNFDTIQLTFSVPVGGTLTQTSKAYDVVTFELDQTAINATDYEYKFLLKDKIEEEWLQGVGSVPADSIGITIHSLEVEDAPQYDGRFFVKVKRDIIIDTYIVSQATESLLVEQVATTTVPFYYLSDSGSHDGNDTSGNGSKTNTSTEWQDFFNATSSDKSCWFIDQAYFDGYFPPSDESYLNDHGLSDKGSNSYTYDTNTTKNAATGGWNKGIWTDGGGQTWMYLSFGYIKYLGNTTWQSNVDRLINHNPGTSQIELANQCADWASGVPGCDSASWVAAKEDMYDNVYAETNDRIKVWKIGDPVLNPEHGDEAAVVASLYHGSKFRFGNDPDNTVYTISAPPEKYYHLNHYNYDDMYDGFGLSPGSNGVGAWGVWWTGSSGNMQWAATEYLIKEFAKLGHANNRRVTWRIPIDKDPTASTSSYNPLDGGGASATVPGSIQFIEEQWSSVDGEVVAEDPAVWETEPKQSNDLDIYYEVDGTFPLKINNTTNYTFAPIGTNVTVGYAPHLGQGGGYPRRVVSWDNNIVTLDEPINTTEFLWNSGMFIFVEHEIITFHREDGSCVKAKMISWPDNYLDEIINAPTDMRMSYTIEIDPDVSKSEVSLAWFNCYSFGNGVESDRIRDDFNQVKVDKGAKASSTLDEPYEAEHRKYGLIYSGLYNSTSGVNNLNQFNSAEKITKDINPIYGSIQKLHSRSTADGDLITLCEDRILKILASKDAVFNADGNPQLTATNRVLGQAMPFSGEYGISTNPESFASEAYRAYFTDKVRGTVMRLSKDGLTPISDHGMKDWFRDNLKLNDTLTGSYDDKKDEYNITIKQTNDTKLNAIGGATVSFREDVKGWVSFKSFVSENAISCANEYYSLKNGRMWLHHVEQTNFVNQEIGRNTYYNVFRDSSFNVILNDVPTSVKSFNTINYEGSQSKITQLLTDGEYHNLNDKTGWYVQSILTNKETGTINEFIEKEGKWFNYIKGQNIQHAGQFILMNPDGSSTFDQASFAIQGIGVLAIPPVVVVLQGCTDPTAINYEDWAQIEFDPSTCISVVLGCMELTAGNTNFSANTEDGSCLWFGCTINDGTQVNPTAFPAIAYSYSSSNTIVDDGSCVPWVYGCTDATALNYNPLANTNATSPTDATDPCIPFLYGCMIVDSDNYDIVANTDDGTCTWLGCTNVLATNYGWFGWGAASFPGPAGSYVASGSTYGIQNNASACTGGGCMTATADNYDAAATFDDGTCFTCDWTTSGSGAPITMMRQDVSTSGAFDGEVAVIIAGPSAPYQPWTYSLEDALGNIYTSYTSGLTVGGISNPDSVVFLGLPEGVYTAVIEAPHPNGNGVCTFDGLSTTVEVAIVVIYPGCTDVTACNFMFIADATHVDNGSCEWVTCAGCTEVWATQQDGGTNPFANTIQGAFNTQTGTTQPCTDPDGVNAVACTIQCGDGTDNNDTGNWCCAQTIIACYDATACNTALQTGGGNFPTYENDPSLCIYSGCMDDSSGEFPDINGNDENGNACGYPCVDGSGNEIGYNANNFAPCATVAANWTCDYDQVGCMDPAACNLDAAATIDDGSCLLGYTSVTIGDPNTVDDAGGAVGIPVYYYDGAPDITDSVQHNVGGYPAQPFYGENDIGLGIRAVDATMAQYLNTDKVRIRLHKLDASSVWNEVYTEDLSASVNYWDTNSGGGGSTYGMDRVVPGQYDPHPFGPTATSASNYVFDIYTGTIATKQKYALEVSSVLSGIEYGQFTGSSPNCGLWHIFEFNDQSVCQVPGVINGCMDVGACNYDATATCELFNSCLYGPGVPDPFLGYNCIGGSCTQPTGCQQVGVPPGFMPPQFSTLSTCQIACVGV